MLLCNQLNYSFVFRELWFSFVAVSQYYFKDLRKKWSFRRLSTKSSVIDGKDTVGATIWNWYWQKSDTEWEEYSGLVCFVLCFIQYFYVTYQLKVNVKVLKVMFNLWVFHWHLMDGSGGERWNIGLVDGLKSV